MKSYITKNTLNEKKNAVRIETDFYRVPKELFRSERYRELNPNAKIIYIELLDRVGLSIKNGWKDEKGRYYVKLSKESVPKVLGISSKTFDRCKGPLIDHGLIEIRKINSRVHHIYVSLPRESATRTGDYDMFLHELPDF
ncbi:replication initiator protein A [Priestia endophytica]|uniref:replication initiator protein A n=1 Tax=Priestia endophytica TaxID=135735 RepID=UPI00124C39C0|nr:replication initiator protein A [Priestia endophytica]KAB2489981.1 hypothetical protein F8155_21560 [Priestia endophytica]